MAVNPRYMAYGNSVYNTTNYDKILTLDKERWSGGCMTGFILWINKHIHICKEQNPNWFCFGALVEHDNFTNYLKNVKETPKELAELFN